MKPALNRLIVAGLLLFPTVLCAQDIAVSDVTSITEWAWQEAVVSVTDLDRSARFFEDIGGYERKYQGPLDASEIAAWGLPAGASGEALLLGPAGHWPTNVVTVKATGRRRGGWGCSRTFRGPCEATPGRP